MSEHKISAASRKDEGKGASRRLRHAGMIPAVVYGGDAAPQSIQLEHEKTWLISQHEWFYSSIIDLEIDGKVEQALLRDMQRHPYKQIIMHLDFQRVEAGKMLRTSVPLHFVNEAVSPAVKLSGAIIGHIVNELDITCLPKDLPEFIEVDLKDLNAGHSIHVSGLKLPAGVESVALAKGDDITVATIVMTRAMTAEEEAAELAAPTPSAADVPPTAQKAKEEETGKEAGKGGKDEKKDKK